MKLMRVGVGLAKNVLQVEHAAARVSGRAGRRSVE